MGDVSNKKGKNQNIQVFVRLRPINAREKEIKSHIAVEISGNREVLVKQQHFESKHSKKFTFDRAFGPNSTQVEVYKSVVSPLIEEVLSGYSCTVFAYGQTGTGKTFTMAGGNPKFNDCEGSSWKNDPLAGIIPRSINQLFDDLRLAQMEFTIRVSYLELYNEELFDLLAPTIDESSTSKIRIFEDPTKKGSVIVQGLEEVPVKNKSDVYKIISDGQEKRKTAATLMNAQSSRSHTVFSILIHIKEVNATGEAMLKTGKLNLVDLAGSENISKAGNDRKERARETVNINQSLLTLGRVITALVEKTPHIPYRESKLTRLLQDSLGGRTKTSIIATISPGHKDLEETLSTLEYAHRAKYIMNKPEINQKLTQKLAIKGYTDEIDKLRKELYSQREKCGVYLSTENYEEMMGKIDHQNKEISENLQKLRAYDAERSKTIKIFDDLKNKYLRAKKQLECTKNNLIVVEKKFKRTEKNLKKAEIVNKEKSHIIEVQAKIEEVLSSQAKQLIHVAEVTTNDTEKLQNVLDTRRQIDHIIKTSAELFNDRMKQSLQSKKDFLTENFVQCINTNVEIKDDLGNLHISTKQILENLLKSMQNTSDRVTKLLNELNKLDQSSISSVNSLLLKTHQYNSDLLQQHFSYISNTYTEMHRLLSEQMFEEYKEREQFDNIVFDGLSERMNENIDITKQYVESHCHQGNSLKALFEEVFTYFEEHIEKKDTLTDLKDRAQNLFNVMQRNCLDFSDKYMSNANFCLDSISSSKIKSNYLKEKQKKIMCDINEDVSELITKTQSTMSLVDNSNKESHNNATKLLEDLSKSLKNQYEKFQNMVERDLCDKEFLLNTEFELITTHVDNIIVKNRSLDQVLEHLSETVSGCLNEVSQEIDKYCSEELEVYRPTGETPIRKSHQFPKVLASTSPHDRILQRFRMEQGYNGHCESLDNSIIELDESFDEVSTLDQDDLEKHDETAGLLSRSKWSSEACILQTSSTEVAETPKQFKLSKSVSAIEIRENNVPIYLGKENLPEERPKSASKYDRNISSIPIHRRYDERVLKMNNN